MSDTLPEEVIAKELKRQEFMQKIVEQVEREIQAFTTDGTKQLYLSYKIGALILTKGLEAIDKQVFAIDLGMLKTEESQQTQKCICGRNSDTVEDRGRKFTVCAGCYKPFPACHCIRLSV